MKGIVATSKHEKGSLKHIPTNNNKHRPQKYNIQRFINVYPRQADSTIEVKGIILERKAAIMNSKRL